MRRGCFAESVTNAWTTAIFCPGKDRAIISNHASISPLQWWWALSRMAWVMLTCAQCWHVPMTQAILVENSTYVSTAPGARCIWHDSVSHYGVWEERPFIPVGAGRTPNLTLNLLSAGCNCWVTCTWCCLKAGFPVMWGELPFLCRQQYGACNM